MGRGNTDREDMDRGTMDRRSENASDAAGLSPPEEIRLLQRELAFVKRDSDQWRRTALTSEALSTRSKRVMLRKQEELERSIQALEQANARAVAASEAKGRFLAVMSHEIRTPISGVIGALELLLTTDLSKEQLELADIMQNSSGALLHVINNVLDYSRAEAGAIELERVRFDPRECLVQVAETVRASALAKGVETRCVVGDDVPARLVGDVARLKQVLYNLVGNAVKFTSDGHVEVSLCSVDERFCFTVADTGVGIREDAIEHIFDEFSQEDSSTTRRFGGTGLGLAISKRLVRAMGGNLSVESKVGVGSRFVFSIPIEEVVSKPAVPSVDPAHTRVEKLTPIGHGRTALVVDDNKVNRLIAQRLLQNLGFEVLCAENGATALTELESHHADVVLMDCSMPVMDGYEASRRIRASSRWAQVKIVALTALALDGDREKCLQAGMDDYLSKPLQTGMLRRVLERILEADRAA